MSPSAGDSVDDLVDEVGETGQLAGKVVAVGVDVARRRTPLFPGLWCGAPIISGKPVADQGQPIAGEDQAVSVRVVEYLRRAVGG